MEWIRFEDLERLYGGRSIFSGASGVVRDGARVGLVGANGAGKSSLVRILAGLDEPDAGTLARARGARLGYLSQTSASETHETLGTLLASAFDRIHAEEAALRALESDLAAAAHRGDGASEARLLERYGDAREAFERHGGASTERKLQAMLAAFEFEPRDLERPTSEFSGGQRTRAALARLFLEEPDFFILDEPTNHLDIDTVRKLEAMLVDDPRACIVVSHDRYFLDRVATEIWDLDRGTLAIYVCTPGDAYADYQRQKAQRLAQAQRDYAAFAAEEKRGRDAVAELRTHGSHNYAQVRSREKALARIERVEAPDEREQRIAIRLNAARTATRGYAIRVTGVAKAFDRPLFANLSFDVVRGERLAIVGENGSGKSTLLAILAGKLKPDAGRVRTSEGVRLAYFSQDTADDLPPESTAAEAVLAAAPVTNQTARALLGSLGLGGAAAEKRVEDFSGGERRRIMLARLMAQPSDCLLLDEPTNDLDIASREALESVLDGYGGALVVISHDRYLLKRVAQRVLFLGDGEATTFDGGYDAFEARARGEVATAPAARRSPAAGERDERRDERARRAKLERELAACEADVARLDSERATLDFEYADPGIYGEPQRLEALGAERKRVAAALDAAMQRWEALVARAEDAAAVEPMG